MDTRSGQILSPEQQKMVDSVDTPYIREMGYFPTPIQRAEMRVGRNDPCPCGSGMKFKKCCLFGGAKNNLK